MAGREFMVIAGEVSGDMLAAGLVQALKRRDPALRFFGIGGDALRAAGMEILQDSANMAVMGFTEALARLPFFARVFRRMEAAAAARRPAAVILVDYPGFNLRFAASARRLGLPVIYYVCPQVWAWHRGRIAAMAQSVDRLLTIFPFEKDQLAGSGIAIDFVGHPLVAVAQAIRAAPPAPLPWQGPPRLALLPGSRREEIDRLLPDMLEAAARLDRDFPTLSCLIATPTEADAKAMEARLARAAGPRPARLAVVGGRTREVLKQAAAAAVASGTATMETALMRCPMAIVYRVGPLSAILARRLIRVPFIGMVNLIAGRMVCPELLQQSLSPASLAAALRPLLAPTPERDAMLEGLDDVIRRLGGPGAEDRAAAAVLKTLEPDEQGASHGE